jgi:hypothetical protein
MMKQTSSERCTSYDKAVAAKKKAAKKAQQDFGGKEEDGWKVRIRARGTTRTTTHYDVKTFKHVEPPKEKQTDTAP